MQSNYLLGYCLVFVSFRGCFSFKEHFKQLEDRCDDVSLSKEFPYQPCCDFIKFFPSSVRRRIQTVTGCTCNNDCQRKRILCKHGRCDKISGKCICENCWSGSQCDQYTNKNKPKLFTKKLRVHIENVQPLYKLFTNVNAYDEDKRLCSTQKHCPCGDLGYRLLEPSNVFHIDRRNGGLSLKQPPQLPKYNLIVGVANVGDKYPDNETKASLEVIINNVSLDHLAVVHHRSRRTVTDGIYVAITPYLNMPSSYIDTNDEVKFHMQLVYNITMGATLSATLTVSSSLLKVIDCNAKGWPVYLHFDGIMIKSSIEAGSTYNANFTTRIKENVQPYSRLIVDIEAVFFYTGFDYETKFYKSTPIVRAAVPSIKFGELIGNNVSVNAQFVMTIEIILPLLPAFTLRSEITTDNEDYVFMSIDNVTVSFIGSGIKLNGSQVVKNSSIQGYGNIDIVKGATIDFGNVQISNESTISQRTILVSCVIKVNPHPMLMEGSSHYIGFGVQAGPIFLVAKNKSVIIQANAERDLYLMMEKPANRSSWLFSGDNVNITYKIGYTTNSIVADNLLAIFSTKYFLLTNVYQSGVIPPFGSINATAYKVDLGTTLKQGDAFQGELELTLKSNISPLLKLSTTMTLFYDNNKTAQDPIVTTADLFTSGTPVVTYEMKDQSNITSGMKRTLFITILLIKMSSPIKVELVTSVANRLPVMHILSFDVVHVGKNIKGLNNSATATFFTTTNDTSSRDQAALNLGIGVNESPSTANSTHNQIQLSCEVIAVENRNMTNSSSYSIASGLIAEPRLMWVGRFLINSYISSDRRPKLFLKYDFTENGDTYTFNVFINHTEHSDQVAYNVTLEYYLPPYLEFVNWTGDNSVQKQAKDTRFLVKKLFFTSEISNSITAILRKKKSPQTGEVDFVVPIRLQYTDVENTKKWRYWKSVKLSVEVPESPPIIGRSVKAKPNFYGRGFYIDNTSGFVYVCMSQHVTSQIPACYFTDDDGAGWIRLDSRIGCVLGHDNSRVLYAIARNQITYMKHNSTEDEWYPVTDNAFPMNNFQFKNVENAEGIKARHLPPAQYTKQLISGKQWTGTDHGLFYRRTSGHDWVLRARWRL